ncbi:hypothetical protein MMC28_001095 [Mycoblastus sanguinarius]|nr:hypothetical protein [Mycoblastus sanguinarius]
MPTTTLRAALTATEHDKGVKWKKNIEVIDGHKFSRPSGLFQRPSYVSEQEIDPPRRSGDHDLPNTAASMATVDEDSPWAKKTILSLDGGGVRGYSSLLILRELMRMIGDIERLADGDATSSAYSPLIDCLPDEARTALRSDTQPLSKYLPCHYFDYIAGTSTGGLIAIMLGRLRLSVDEVIEEYKQLSANVFEKPSSRLKRLLTKYNSATRRENLKGQFDALRPTQPSPHEQSDQFKSDPIRCRTIVCSIKSSQSKDFQTPFLFRSYNHSKTLSSSITPLERNPDDHHEFAISDVARATSAAPSFFKSISLFEARYYDAAVDLNNPSWEVVNEVSLLAGGSHDAIDVLLSVGAGNTKGNKSKTKFRGNSLQQDLTDISDVVHNKVRSESEQQLFSYYRLEVDEGLQDVRLNEWKPKPKGNITLQRIKHATDKYLSQEYVRSQCQQCAAALVRRRTTRAQTLRWEGFANGTWYRCPIPDCSTPKARFKNRNSLMDHLRMQHNKAPPDAEHYHEIQALLDKGRTNSE